jgi:hypothetical protein
MSRPLTRAGFDWNYGSLFATRLGVGIGFGPLGTGMLSDLIASKAMRGVGAAVMAEPFKAAALHDVMHVIPLLCLILGVVLLAATRAMPGDCERLRARMRDQGDGNARVPSARE